MGKYFIGVLVIVTLFMADQLSKWGIVEGLFSEDTTPFFQWLGDISQERLGFISHEILPFFNLVMVWNDGISFGMLGSDSPMSAYLLSMFALLIVSGFLVWYTLTSSRLIEIASLLVVAGALGNIWDRIRFGAVIDFLDFHAFGWHYPAFNVADSCIVIGIMLFLFHTLFLDQKED